MKHHTIKLSDLEDFNPKVRLAASHGEEENKSLDMIIYPFDKKIEFVVKIFDRVIVAGDLDSAIDFYNDGF